MRSDAKASTAGSTQRQANGLGRILRGAFATRGASPRVEGRSAPKASRLVLPAAILALVLAIAALPASASKTHFFKEVFGSAAQPSFTAPMGMAIDQGSGDVLVIDATAATVSRYNPDGTPDSFSALGTNVIDGAGPGDGTPQGNLGFGAANRVQIAIDESGGATDGNIYVAQAAAKLVDVFGSSGSYLGQLTESSVGPFGDVCGVAADSTGALYVGDISGQVHKFVPAANPPVKADNTASFATLASPCQIAAGTGPTAGFIFVNRSNGELFKLDSSTGESKYSLGTSHQTVTVDPATGHVYAPRLTGGSSEVVEYDASGAASATKVSSFKPGSTTQGVAVNEASGNVYVSRSGVSNVQVYGPTVALPEVASPAATNNSGTKATLNGTVNPDGVELDECFFEWGKTTAYGNIAACAEIPAVIGTGTSPVAVHADITGLQPNGITYNFRLVAKNANGTVNSANANFVTPNTVITTAASGLAPNAATVNGTVNPDGVAMTECFFEWGVEKGLTDPVQTYPETAPCVPGPGGIGTGTSPVAVSASLSGLHPGTVYHYRLKAANANGSILSDALTLQTTGPVIKGTWSESVVRTEAALKAEIDPEGSATTYHFEYGTTEAYGSETPELPVGSDSSAHEVTWLLEDLQPDTTYHYRAVATGGVVVNEGADHTLSTYEISVPDTNCPNQASRVGPAIDLPDCRAYEMVSPVDKNGGDIWQSYGPAEVRAGYNQSALDGNKLAYTSATSFGDQVSARHANQYIATRGGNGWTTHGINAPAGPTTSPLLISGWADLATVFKLFTPDLSSAWVTDNTAKPLTPDAGQAIMNLFRRDNLTDSYEALTTSTPTTAGSEEEYHIEVQGHSQDFSHIVFAVDGALTPNSAASIRRQVYDYVDGELHLVSVLPNGNANTVESNAGTITNNRETQASFNNAVSDDGSRIFWTSGTAAGEIFVRMNPDQPQSALNGSGECTEPAMACTKFVGGSSSFLAGGQFWTASSDGSRVIYSEGNFKEGASKAALREFDVDNETTRTIAGEVSGVLGASEDASYIYFDSKEALAPGATAGEPNVYLEREGTITYIATLAPGDIGSQALGNLADVPTVDSALAREHAARVTPDGRHLAFQSVRSLTGYDNTVAANGKSAMEVYLYDADSDTLSCPSCNSSGARPITQRLAFPYAPGVQELTNIWAAAWLPTWSHNLYAPRALADDGSRLYFNSFDALVPQDSNGAQDVYQWEAQGTGTCQEADGCVSLISTGQSPEKSEFVDATPDGRDVFIETKSSIDFRDPGLIDIYDVRVGGGFQPPAPPSPCVGDACQSAPAAPNDATPASASFRGAGSSSPRSNCASQSKRAARLSRQAKRLRRRGSHASSAEEAASLRKRSARLAKDAKRLDKSAARCRRANRGAGR